MAFEAAQNNLSILKTTTYRYLSRMSVFFCRGSLLEEQRVSQSVGEAFVMKIRNMPRAK
ncbi:hypothetical protein Plhal703r1_c41g0141291 [Plasmopara halstedii]